MPWTDTCPVSRAAEVYSVTFQVAMEQTFRVRAAVRIVCKNRLWVPHALQSVDDYLVGRLSYKVLSAACEASASELTLEYLLGKTIPDWDEAVKAAARGGHTHVLRWMTERDDGRGPWKFAFVGILQVAATHGHLDAVKWLLSGAWTGTR